MGILIAILAQWIGEVFHDIMGWHGGQMAGSAKSALKERRRVAFIKFAGGAGVCFAIAGIGKVLPGIAKALPEIEKVLRGIVDPPPPRPDPPDVPSSEPGQSTAPPKGNVSVGPAHPSAKGNDLERLRAGAGGRSPDMANQPRSEPMATRERPSPVVRGPHWSPRPRPPWPPPQQDRWRGPVEPSPTPLRYPRHRGVRPGVEPGRRCGMRSARC